VRERERERGFARVCVCVWLNVCVCVCWCALTERQLQRLKCVDHEICTRYSYNIHVCIGCGGVGKLDRWETGLGGNVQADTQASSRHADTQTDR